MLAQFQELDAARRRIRYLETQLALKKTRADDLLALGNLYLRFQRAADAQRTLAEYLVQAPTDPQGHRALAAAYSQASDQARARAALQLAMALESRHDGKQDVRR